MEVRGAEALVKISDTVLKTRLKKGYRIKELDDKLRFERTRREVKLLSKARSAGVNCPKTLRSGADFIEMERVKGIVLRDRLDTAKNWEEICEKTGESIRKLHDHDIIHGDLTTSNIMLSKESVYFIDFGLGFESKRYEDKAVDLRALEEALNAKHASKAEGYFNKIMQAYGDNKQVISRLEKIRKRGRYL